MQSDKFYNLLATLVVRNKGSDIVIVKRDFSDQFRKLSALDVRLDGCYALLAQRAANKT